jgi:hypothetical protein
MQYALERSHTREAIHAHLEGGPRSNYLRANLLADGLAMAAWMAMRGALTGSVSELNRNYHIPISNTASATVVYENQMKDNRKAA